MNDLSAARKHLNYKNLEKCPPREVIQTSLRSEGIKQERGMLPEKRTLILSVINAAKGRPQLRSGTEGTAGLAPPPRSLSGRAAPDGSSGPHPGPPPPPDPPCRCPGASPGSCWACGTAGWCRRQAGAPRRGRRAAAARRCRPWLRPAPATALPHGAARAETRSEHLVPG